MKPIGKQKNIRSWPADRVERWAVDKLFPYAKNARLHTPADIRVIAGSIARWGFTNPVLVDEAGLIIAGHGRVLAAKLLALVTIPVMVAAGWSEAERKAYCLADNRIAERATWDSEMLRGELASLQGLDFDTSLISFDPDAIQEIMAGAKSFGQTDPDAVGDPPATPVSRLGDCWVLDRHRVGCGDSTDSATVALAFGENSPVLMATDPPYGIEYDPGWRGRADGAKAGRSTGKVLNDDRADWRGAWAHYPGDVAYVWHASLFGGLVADSLAACNFELRSQLIWVKQHFALSRADYHWQHECCLYAVRKGAKSHWASDRKQSTVWEFPNNGAIGNSKREKTWGHGTQKPVEAMRRPIENNSRPGDVVYDPFLGSGTTLIAAEMTGRICVGLELSPAYVDVIVRRWMEFTGKEAILAASGKSFATTAEERGASSGGYDVVRGP